MIEDLFVEPKDTQLSGRTQEHIIRNELLTLNPAIRTIPVFREILARDKGSASDANGVLKLLASKEIAFIYHFTNPFRFAAYDDDVRADKIKELVGLGKNWHPDQLISDAVEVLANLILTAYPELVAVNRSESVLRTYIEILELKDKKNKEFLRQYTKIDAKTMTIAEITEITQAIDAISDEIPKTMKMLKELKPAINDILDLKKDVQYYIKAKGAKVVATKGGTSPFDFKAQRIERETFK